MGGPDKLGPKINTTNQIGQTEQVNPPVIDNSPRVESQSPVNVNKFTNAVASFFGNRVRAGKAKQSSVDLAMAKLDAGDMNFNPSGGDSTPIAGA